MNDILNDPGRASIMALTIHFATVYRGWQIQNSFLSPDRGRMYLGINAMTIHSSR